MTQKGVFSFLFFLFFSNTKAKFPVKLTAPLTSILYITADKIHMEEYKHAIHVKEIAEGKFILLCCTHNSQNSQEFWLF